MRALTSYEDRPFGAPLNDIEHCTVLLRAICEQVRDELCFVVPGQPRSKARPRFSGNGRVYSDKKQRAHEQYLRSEMMAARKRIFNGNVAVACVFYRASKTRVDVDNLLKQIFDSANKVLWEDDMQVTACAGLLRMDAENPRTVIAVGELVKTQSEYLLDRYNQDLKSKCLNCGKEFTWRKYRSSRRTGNFCSIECSNRYGKIDLRALAKCRCCGKTFKRRYGAQSICSEECRVKLMVQRNKKGSLGPSYCRCCGKKVSRPEIIRCRECFRAGRKVIQGTIGAA